MLKLQDEKESHDTNSPLSPFHNKSKTALQIENAVSSITNQKNGEILERSTDHYTLLIRPQVEREDNINYYYVLNFKQKQYSIVCSYRLDNFENIIKKKGYCNFLFTINDWNAQNENGKVMIWSADEKTIKIKTCSIVLAEGQNIRSNLLSNLSKLQNDMKNFMIKITPKTIKLLTMACKSWQKYKTGDQIKNLLCIKNVISNHLHLNLNKSSKSDTLDSIQQNQYVSSKNLTQDRNTFAKLQQELYQNLNNYEYKLQNKSFIVRGITIENQLYDKNHQSEKIFQKIRTLYCQYQLYSQNGSVNKNTNSAISQYEENNSLKLSQQNQKQKQISYHVKGYLIEKKSITQDTQSFENQVYMLLYMRLFKCQNIAHYYLESFAKEKDIKRILIKLYPKSIDFNFSLHNKLKIVFKIAMAIYFMHSKLIVHRDLKFGNIMLDNHLEPKIIDFGSSCIVNTLETQESNEKQLFPTVKLKTTRFYNKFYEQCNRDVMGKISKNQYETHPLFDIYAFGKIVYMLFDDQQTRRNLGCLGNDLISFLIQVCTQQNPNLRITPSWILLYLSQMQQIRKSYLFFQKIQRKKQYMYKKQAKIHN